MVPPDEFFSRDGGDATAAHATGQGGGADATTIVLPPPAPGSDPNAPRWVMVKPSPDGGPGQVIVMEPGAAPPHGPDAWDEPVRPVPPPPPAPEQREWHRFRPWGMNLRVEGMLLPRRTHRFDDDAEGAGLLGLGLGLRFRPVDIFAIEAATDFFAGRDTNGYSRREIPLNLSAIFYVNPDDVVQFMAFGGANFAFAQVFSDHTEDHLAQGDADEYTYLGGHLGVGLEFRVSDLIGIDIDGYGLLRTRTDTDFGGRYPEYVDEDSGDTSNTTVAAVLRGGLTFWW